MADATLYAWSPIRYDAETDADGNFLKVKTLEMGETVTASKLGIDKAELKALCESGAVRAVKPPELPEGYQGSVVDFLRNQAAQAEVAFASGVGGSYFGPNMEEVLMDPSVALTAEGVTDKDDPATLAEDAAEAAAKEEAGAGSTT